MTPRMLSQPFLAQAVERCLRELRYAKDYHTALARIEHLNDKRTYSEYNCDFFVLARNAMFEDMVTKCLRILDPREQAGLELPQEMLLAGSSRKATRELIISCGSAVPLA